MFPEKLKQKIENRKANNTLRDIGKTQNKIDFSSNDYLGFAISESIFHKTHQLLIDRNILVNGATGSRLISGNHNLYSETEDFIAKYHRANKALMFNSGYDANVGFFSAVPQRGDIILYDELIHASIRDGIQLSNAKAYKFKHNNVVHLEQLLFRYSSVDVSIYVVTESVFSMDGDSALLIEISNICKKHKSFLIVDEAHALGVFGENGVGLVQSLKLENEVFARIITFGKALGCHGAVVLGSEQLIEYLINFSRSFIYTTGLSPHAVATVQIAYQHLKSAIIEELQYNISHFKAELKRLELTKLFIESNSAIHCCVISGNNKTKEIAKYMEKEGFNIKAILSPTVAKGKERLRFCLHAFDKKEDITKVLTILNGL